MFAQNLIFIFDNLFFYEKSKSRYFLCIKNIQCKILFRGNISEPKKKNPSISDEYEYLNIRIKWP